jgi:cytochrome b subunit of formate dehydrogenase
MSGSNGVSPKTRTNWLIDAAVFGSALIAALSGIYFLFLPSGAYQGGRNPFYGVTILFQRATWEDLHTWGGVIMIAAVVVHLAIHWKWVTGTLKRVSKKLTAGTGSINRHAWFNIGIDATIALSFLITALSGVYFLFVPGGRGAIDPLLLFARSTWDVLHTWGGVVLIISAVIHFAIHWRWIVKVTRNVLGSIGRTSAPAAVKVTH